MSALKEEFKLKYLPESKGNYVHAMKQQLRDYDQIVSRRTMKSYEKSRKTFMKTMRQNCRASYQVSHTKGRWINNDERKKDQFEQFVDGTIEEDLRFFKANYS